MKSKVFSKKTKARLYTTIIRLTLTYAIWVRGMDYRLPLWYSTERKLRTFENKIWRVIYGPVQYDEEGTWVMEIIEVIDILIFIYLWGEVEKKVQKRTRNGGRLR